MSLFDNFVLIRKLIHFPAALAGKSSKAVSRYELQLMFLTQRQTAEGPTAHLSLGFATHVSTEGDKRNVFYILHSLYQVTTHASMQRQTT